MLHASFFIFSQISLTHFTAEPVENSNFYSLRFKRTSDDGRFSNSPTSVSGRGALMNAGKNGHPTIIFERDMQEDPNLAHTDIIIFKKC